MGDLFVFLRICSRKTGITVVWENVISFLIPCVSPPSLTSPLSLPAQYLVSISLIFSFFYKLQPPLLRKDNNPEAAWRELLTWNQNARHVPAHQKQAVLACSSASPETLRMLGCKAFWWFESKWNKKLNSKFILLRIRNDLPSPGSGIQVFEQMWLLCLAPLHDEVCPSSAPLWRHVTEPSSDKSSIEAFWQDPIPHPFWMETWLVHS